MNLEHSAVTLDELRDEYVRLASSSSEQKRGLNFESFLRRLFLHGDIEYHLDYKIDGEQIDGFFFYGSHHFIVEAKWKKKPLQSTDVDTLKNKVERKALGTRGLMVAVNGFTRNAISLHSNNTALIYVDGIDIEYVLKGRVVLKSLLHRKLQHASQRGSPYVSAAVLYGESW